MTIFNIKQCGWTLSLMALLALPAVAQTQVDVNKDPVRFQGAQPVHKSDKVVAPVRDVAEKMGATVQYDKTDHKVTIETPKKTDNSAVTTTNTATPTENTQTTTPSTTMPTGNAQTTAPATMTPTGNTQTTPPVAMTTPAPSQPVETSPVPAPVVSSTPAAAPETHDGSYLPYVVGAIVLLGLLAYFLNRRGKTGQVIAQDDRTNK